MSTPVASAVEIPRQTLFPFPPPEERPFAASRHLRIVFLAAGGLDTGGGGAFLFRAQGQPRIHKLSRVHLRRLLHQSGVLPQAASSSAAYFSSCIALSFIVSPNQ